MNSKHKENQTPPRFPPSPAYLSKSLNWLLSNFSAHEIHLEGLFKYKLRGPCLRVSHSVGLMRPENLPTLLVPGSYSENHCLTLISAVASVLIKKIIILIHCLQAKLMMQLKSACFEREQEKAVRQLH